MIRFDPIAGDLFAPDYINATWDSGEGRGALVWWCGGKALEFDTHDRFARACRLARTFGFEVDMFSIHSMGIMEPADVDIWMGNRNDEE